MCPYIYTSGDACCPKKSLATLALFREPCRSANKGTPCKINFTKNKWIEETKTRHRRWSALRLARYFFASLFQSLNLFYLVAFLFLQFVPNSSPYPLFAPFWHFISLFKEILAPIILLQNSPVFYLQLCLLVCGYSGIEKTESKRKKILAFIWIVAFL